MTTNKFTQNYTDETHKYNAEQENRQKRYIHFSRVKATVHNENITSMNLYRQSNFKMKKIIINKKQ